MFMVATKLARSAVLVAAIALAIALCGCGLFTENDSSAPEEGTLAASYGLPRLPAAQGIIDFSPKRAVEVLANFEYREHDGEGQWANATDAFAILDNDAQATSEAPMASGAAGWVLQLSSYDKGEWHTCTLEDLQSGVDPSRAMILVFSQKGIALDSIQEAADFLDALYSCARGVVALESDGHIAHAVLKNTTGAVCEITQDAPGMFRLSIHPKSDWEDGTYDGLVAECKKYATENSCSYGEFLKSVPLFEEPRMELVG